MCYLFRATVFPVGKYKTMALSNQNRPKRESQGERGTPESLLENWHVVLVTDGKFKQHAVYSVCDDRLCGSWKGGILWFYKCEKSLRRCMSNKDHQLILERRAKETKRPGWGKDVFEEQNTMCVYNYLFNYKIDRKLFMVQCVLHEANF